MNSYNEKNNKKTVIGIISVCLLGSITLLSIPISMSGRVSSLIPISLVAIFIVVGGAFKVAKIL